LEGKTRCWEKRKKWWVFSKTMSTLKEAKVWTGQRGDKEEKMLGRREGKGTNVW